MDTASKVSAAAKYAITGRQSSVSKCTDDMVRNMSAGSSRKNTTLDKSLIEDSRIHWRRPAR